MSLILPLSFIKHFTFVAYDFKYEYEVDNVKIWAQIVAENVYIYVCQNVFFSCHFDIFLFLCLCDINMLLKLKIVSCLILTNFYVVVCLYLSPPIEQHETMRREEERGGRG